MKKLILMFPVAGMLLVTSCNGEKSKEKSKKEALEAADELEDEGTAGSALEYNDGIVGLQMRILNRMMEFVNYEGEDPMTPLQACVEEINTSIDALDKLEPYTGGEELKAAAMDLFMYYKEISEGPWMKAVMIVQEAGDNLTDEQAEEVQRLFAEAGEREKEFDAQFAAAQEAFASENGFSIQRNPMQDDIDAMTE
jgi:hypothetical protein